MASAARLIVRKRRRLCRAFRAIVLFAFIGCFLSFYLMVKLA
jgi:hypothetical protein